MDDPAVQAFIQQQVAAQVGAALVHIQAEAAAAAAAAAPVIAPAPRLKPAKPEAFYGKPNEDVGLWIFQTNLWFTGAGNLTDIEKITLASGLLRGAALIWWRSVYDQPPMPATWEAFKTAITHAFQPINPAETARDRLANLHQTGPVSTYAATFRSIALQIPGITDDEKRDRFIRGLKKWTMQDVKLRNPATFDEAVCVAVRFDSIHTWRSNPNSGKTVSRISNPEPMEVDSGKLYATRSQPFFAAANALNSRPPYRTPSAPLRKPLTDREREELRRANKCFKCRQAGHLARDCPERAGRPN